VVLRMVLFMLVSEVVRMMVAWCGGRFFKEIEVFIFGAQCGGDDIDEVRCAGGYARKDSGGSPGT